jgi:hypothetical protein
MEGRVRQADARDASALPVAKRKHSPPLHSVSLGTRSRRAHDISARAYLRADAPTDSVLTPGKTGDSNRVYAGNRKLRGTALWRVYSSFGSTKPSMRRSADAGTKTEPRRPPGASHGPGRPANPSASRGDDPQRGMTSRISVQVLLRREGPEFASTRPWARLRERLTLALRALRARSERRRCARKSSEAAARPRRLRLPRAPEAIAAISGHAWCAAPLGQGSEGAVRPPRAGHGSSMRS